MGSSWRNRAHPCARERRGRLSRLNVFITSLHRLARQNIRFQHLSHGGRYVPNSLYILATFAWADEHRRPT